MQECNVTRSALNEVASDVIELLLQKNADYGDAWQKQWVAGVLVRLSDKSMRLERLSTGRIAFVVDEKWRDTLKDIAGYALLGLLLDDMPKDDSQ